MMAAKKAKQKTKAPGGGYVVGPHRWCFHRWPQEFGLNIDKVDAGQNLFAKCIQKKPSHLPASPLPATPFSFPSTFSFPPLFSFPAAGLIIKKEIIKVLCHVCVFWLTTAAKALSWGCHSHIRSSPMVFFLVGPLKVQKNASNSDPKLGWHQ